MKILKSIVLDQYHDEARFEKVNESIYRDLSNGNYKITLSCQLEKDEDSQYPLEDILENYYVNCTDYIVQHGDSLVFELEGSLKDNEVNRSNIEAVSSLIGTTVTG